jgi:hypothetical protein
MKYPWSLDCRFLGPAARETDLDSAQKLNRSSFVKGGTSHQWLSHSFPEEAIGSTGKRLVVDNHSLIVNERTQSKVHRQPIPAEMNTTTYTAAGLKSSS